MGVGEKERSGYLIRTGQPRTDHPVQRVYLGRRHSHFPYCIFLHNYMARICVVVVGIRTYIVEISFAVIRGGM